jgi:hypothetical protein
MQGGGWLTDYYSSMLKCVMKVLLKQVQKQGSRQNTTEAAVQWFECSPPPWWLPTHARSYEY